jgi:hypothetical protein
MCLMASANHLLMVFMAVEMASVPSYVLAGMLKGRRLGSEAALKYSIYGAGAAGVMLYGISLLAGLLHTAHLPTLAARLAAELPHMSREEYMVLALAGLMIMVGVAFKLSAVPFHFWCPDVFEGATAEVNAFLSVASDWAESRRRAWHRDIERWRPRRARGAARRCPTDRDCLLSRTRLPAEPRSTRPRLRRRIRVRRRIPRRRTLPHSFEGWHPLAISSAN